MPSATPALRQVWARLIYFTYYSLLGALVIFKKYVDGMINLWQQGRGVGLLLVRVIWRIGLSILLLVLVLGAFGGLYLAYTYHFGFSFKFNN